MHVAHLAQNQLELNHLARRVTYGIVRHIKCGQRRIGTANTWTQKHLDNPPYLSEQIGWSAQIAYKMYKLKNRKLWVAWLYVRECIADRGSASITNLVRWKVQYLQRLVLTVNQNHTHFVNGPLSETKCIKCRKISGGVIVSYIKASARAVAPSLPIRFPLYLSRPRFNACKVELKLLKMNKNNIQLDNAHETQINMIMSPYQ